MTEYEKQALEEMDRLKEEYLLDFMNYHVYLATMADYLDSKDEYEMS